MVVRVLLELQVVQVHQEQVEPLFNG
jgi:hypothetical protein